MKKLLSILGGALVVAALSAPAASAAPCSNPVPIPTSRGLLTAAVVDQPVVAGEVIADGCDIGVYYSDSSLGGAVSNADVHGATRYGVFNDGANGDVDVTNSKIHDIGDTPFSGVQYGIGLLYVGGGDGNVDNNQIYEYQKNGTAFVDSGTRVSITNNTVTGLGVVHFIAQNGIQVSNGAEATAITGNTVSDNIYAQNKNCDKPESVGSCVGVVATGILVFGATASPKQGEVASSNHAFRNQANVTVIK